LKAAIFDMDGLMIDTEPMYKRAWQGAAKELGYEIEDSFYLNLIGRTNIESESMLRDNFGSEFPIERFRALWNSKWSDEAAESGIPKKPGIVELLFWLESSNIRVAVATSNGIEYASLCLSNTGLSEKFEHIVTGDTVTNGKPAPDIFLEAASRLGVAPEDCIALEDSEAGVLSANSAGMRVYLVPDLKEPSQQIKSLAYNVSGSLNHVLYHLQETFYEHRND